MRMKPTNCDGAAAEKRELRILLYPRDLLPINQDSIENQVQSWRRRRRRGAMEEGWWWWRVQSRDEKNLLAAEKEFSCSVHNHPHTQYAAHTHKSDNQQSRGSKTLGL